jgi:NAD(P)-dependent dehydrogenase (short-subunit alcohol dehydrogenase family)
MLKQEPLPVTLPSFQIQRGSIVNTASLCGLGVIGTISAYNSSKHAVVQMSAVDARQYAPEKIRINTVCPGFVETPMLMGSNLSQEYLDSAKAQCPMNRLLQPLEIANAVLFLSGSMASGVTGANLSVDCGAQLYHV